MTEKTNVPEIRFAGFTDPWEQRKLGDICERHKEMVPTPKDGYVRMGVRSHAKGTFLTMVKPGAEIEEKELSRVKAHCLVVNIVFAWEQAIAITSTEDEKALVSHRFPQFLFHDDMHPDYFRYAILNDSFERHLWLASPSGAGRNKTLNVGTMLEYSFTLPNKKEQEAIASCLTRLDSLITLHQRKHDKLVQLKKSMLDKMFPKPGETEPEIRFAGFTDPWEQRKFSDLTDRVSIQSSDSDLPQVEYEDIIPGEGTLNKDLRDKDGGKTGIKFYAGDVLYGKLRPYLMNWLYPQFNGVAVGDFWVLRATECDSSFLYRLIQTNSFQRLANVSSGSKMPRADWKLISQSFFAVPADHAEQKAIAKSLAELDSLITLHQRKRRKRLFTHLLVWEQRKLGDVATIVGGGTPSTNNDAYWDGDIDWYSPAELGERVYADRSVRRITQAGYDSCSATLLPAGKTILFTSRAGIGNTAILRRSACTNQGFQSLVVNDDTDVYFVYSMTDRIKKFAEQKASGSTFLEISGKGLAAGEFAFPSKDEQTAIGSMFKQLDHLITLHQ